MINVNKGWPNGHASEASYPVQEGVDVVEGDFVVLIDDGAGNPVWRLATEAAADDADVLATGGQALDTNTFYGYDVRYANMLPVVRRNYTAQTDRFDTQAAIAVGALAKILIAFLMFASGELLFVSLSSRPKTLTIVLVTSIG